MKMLMMTNMMMNMMFLLMKHPMSMGLTIILQTMIVSMTTGMMFKSFWFSYILFLMYIGGMMIMFIYMTSLMPNMMFHMKNKMIIMALLLLMMTYYTMNKYQKMSNLDMKQMNEQTIMLMKMHMKSTNHNTILMAMYLMYTMITVYNMTESNTSAMKLSKN
uniref:NADH-ubiquinone oxidoreductase chain 6 n=1 Tax=Cryptophyllium westwoodii TaxID=2778107 RepID=A0A7T8E6Y2_9NEOP|nr:NADH dehydrogenase subunit 6 [Cryptophyllium westwoodii]